MTEPGVVEDVSPQGLSQKQLSCSLTSSWNGILFGEGTFRLYDTQMLNETGLFTIIYLQNWVVFGGKCRVNIPSLASGRNCKGRKLYSACRTRQYLIRDWWQGIAGKGSNKNTMQEKAEENAEML